MDKILLLINMHIWANTGISIEMEHIDLWEMATIYQKLIKAYKYN